MKRKQLLLCWASIIAISSFAQPICGFDAVHPLQLQKDSLYRKAVTENERTVQQFLRQHGKSLSQRTTGTNSVTYTIPVVVHVMHTGGSVGSLYNPSDLQIQNTIDYLNQVYNGAYPGTQGIGDLQIQFVLAKKNPACQGTNGIDRIDASSVAGYSANGISTNPGVTPGVNELLVKNLDRWDPNHYYNIWVVNRIDGLDGTSGSFTAGYAYFPGAPAAYDGTIMLATQMRSGQKTLPHEIGHAFGLYHVFEGSSDATTCDANSDCSTSGDMVCDTDPVSFNQLGNVVDFSCRSGINACTGTPYSSNTESNYMNYTTCYNLFTAGQKARMLAFAGSYYRKSLTTSPALTAAYPLATFTNPVSSCTPATGASGLSANYAGIMNIDLNNHSYPSSTARVDNGYRNAANSCLNLIELTRNGTYLFTANVFGANYEQLKAWIDYNNDGVFDNATEQIHVNALIPKNNGVTAGNFTVPSWAQTSTVLRMRVIDELATNYGLPEIADGCYNSTYGQAEDYPVLISAGTLPVTLVNFGGVLKNNVAVLTWTANVEKERQNFIVEKSADGVSFQTIGTVGGNGGTTSTVNYSFTDEHPYETGYYRLRVPTNNGSFTQSQVVILRNGGSRQKVWVVNNPFDTYLDLGFGKAGSQARLQLLSATGVLLAEKVVAAPQGQIRWVVPGHLSRGTYLLKVMVDETLFVLKVVKQ